MPLSYCTLCLASATAPTIISTVFSHYLDPKAVRRTPSEQLSYHVGLNLIRKFLEYASRHTVEEAQAFTSLSVPHPTWVRVEEAAISQDCIDEAAELIVKQLGSNTLEKVGGKLWWRWRTRSLEAEWIEMKRDYKDRCAHPEQAPKTMLYVHGGAFFFSSVDTHRYQLQRHARKLKGRVFAPRYRLSPQFPFPCALLDVLASYLFLLKQQPSSTIILAGDSAGGNLILSTLIILRDNNVSLPAGAILISPWIDLCHSFPSILQGNKCDYLPENGFQFKPSAVWPPPDADDLVSARQGKFLATKSNANDIEEKAKGFTEEETTVQQVDPRPRQYSSLVIDGNLVTLKDQVHLYTTNDMIGHPLVSLCNQASLGGLPPLLVMVGGGEMLRDEQIYIAHKAANPSKYPPRADYLEEDPRQKESLDKYPPTDIQLQVYDHCCHGTPALSFTKPARLMYRAIANFSEWALSRGPSADQTEQLRPYPEAVPSESISLSESSISSISSSQERDSQPIRGRITKKYSPLPPFENHMIRQRIDLRGRIYDLPPEDELPGCQMKPEEVGILKPEPIRRWMDQKRQWDLKFAKLKHEVQNHRVQELAVGYIDEWEGEQPPPSAVSGRRKRDVLPRKKLDTPSLGMRFWEMIGHSHDETEMLKTKKQSNSK